MCDFLAAICGIAKSRTMYAMVFVGHNCIVFVRPVQGRQAKPVADLRGAQGTRAPPGVQIFSISCSFWENSTNSYVGAPPGELAPPPRGNPGSATESGSFYDLGNGLILTITLADPRGGRQGRAPPSRSYFFHLHAVFSKKLTK